METRTAAPVVAVDDVLSRVELVVHIDLAARVGPVQRRAGADDECALIGLRAN